MSSKLASLSFLGGESPIGWIKEFPDIININVGLTKVSKSIKEKKIKKMLI